MILESIKKNIKAVTVIVAISFIVIMAFLMMNKIANEEQKFLNAERTTAICTITETYSKITSPDLSVIYINTEECGNNIQMTSAMKPISARFKEIKESLKVGEKVELEIAWYGTDKARAVTN